MAHRPYNPYDEMAPFRPHPVPGTEAFTRGPGDTRRPGFYSETVPGTPPREQAPDNLESVQGIETSPYIAQILRSDAAKEAALRQYFEQLAASQTPPDQAWGPVAKQMQREYEAQEAASLQKSRLTEAQIAKTQTEARQGDPSTQLKRLKLTDAQEEQAVIDEAVRTGNEGQLDPMSLGKIDAIAMAKAKARRRAGQPAFEGGITPLAEDDNAQQPPVDQTQPAGGGDGQGFASNILQRLFGQAFAGPGGAATPGVGKGKIRNIRVVR